MLFFEIILDVILSVALLVGIIVGYKKGFLKSISKPVRFFTSIAASFWLADPVAEAFFVPIINTPVSNQIKDYLMEHCPQITPDTATDELPTLLKFAASLLDVDISTLSPENTIAEIVDLLASPLVHLISVIISFIIVYFVAKIAFTLLFWLLELFFKSSPLSMPNKILGSLFGLIFALSVAWIFCVVFDFVINSAFFEESEFFLEFEGGPFYRFFNKTNPVDILLGF